MEKACDLASKLLKGFGEATTSCRVPAELYPVLAGRFYEIVFKVLCILFLQQRVLAELNAW